MAILRGGPRDGEEVELACIMDGWPCDSKLFIFEGRLVKYALNSKTKDSLGRYEMDYEEGSE